MTLTSNAASEPICGLCLRPCIVEREGQGIRACRWDGGVRVKPVLIDLFAGRLGWSAPFLDMGWRVVAIDLVLPDMPIPDGVEYVLRDILTMTADDLKVYRPSFVTCSSACEQFSVHGMKHFHPNPPYPEMGIRLFNHSRAILEELGVPYIMENVRPAKNFVGRETNHCGPFYLWGTGVPAMFPREAYGVSKGMSQDRTRGEDGKRLYLAPADRMARKQRASHCAVIPLCVSRTVAELANCIVESCA